MYYIYHAYGIIVERVYHAVGVMKSLILLLKTLCVSTTLIATNKKCCAEGTTTPFSPCGD